MLVKRLRVFAGPNGSGKSTLVRFITSNFHIPFGYFVNADNIEKELKETGEFDFSACDIQVTLRGFDDFVNQSTFNEKTEAPLWNVPPIISNNRLCIDRGNINSYHAALIADFIRKSLLENGTSFTFESVLSDARKLDFLESAKKAGYRVYLYYVATENPEINIARVKNRVSHGGHDVPIEKIVARYERSVQLLPHVVKLTNRAYLFDNSQSLRFIAEINEGDKMDKIQEPIPSWMEGLF
ncbi:MAG: zeta toxin family protein [Saprospiraceae bacterium]|nr:zeta toxin family protein [Saprospiraceae bacterium]